jgi:hypothetical protein
MGLGNKNGCTTVIQSFCKHNSCKQKNVYRIYVYKGGISYKPEIGGAFLQTVRG